MMEFVVLAAIEEFNPEDIINLNFRGTICGIIIHIFYVRKCFFFSNLFE